MATRCAFGMTMVAREGSGKEALRLWGEVLDAGGDAEPELFVLNQSRDHTDVLWAYGLFSSREAYDAHPVRGVADGLLPNRLDYGSASAASPITSALSGLLAVREVQVGVVARAWAYGRVVDESELAASTRASDTVLGERVSILMRAVARTGRADDLAQQWHDAFAGFDHPDGPEIYTFNRSSENPEIIWCYEQWKDLESCRTHLSTDFVRTIVPQMTSAMSMRQNIWGAPVLMRGK